MSELEERHVTDAVEEEDEEDAGSHLPVPLNLLPPALSDLDRLLAYLRRNGLTPGHVYEFADLEAALGKPIGKCRSTIYRARRQLQKSDRRTLVSVANVGYRVAYARESPDIARERARRARNQLIRGQETLAGTDLSQLTQEERQRQDLHMMAMGVLIREVGKHRRHLANLEGRMVEVEERPHLTRAELEFLRRLMNTESPE